MKDDEIAAGIHETETARKQIRQGVSPSYAIKNLNVKNRRIDMAKAVGVKFKDAGKLCSFQPCENRCEDG